MLSRCSKGSSPAESSNLEGHPLLRSILISPITNPSIERWAQVLSESGRIVLHHSNLYIPITNGTRPLVYSSNV